MDDGILIAGLLSPSTLIAFMKGAFGLGIVIFVHELGHFLVAKACGVKCEKFYVGFDRGPGTSQSGATDNSRNYNVDFRACYEIFGRSFANDELGAAWE